MSPSVCCKLDRVLVNSNWMSSNLVGQAEFIAPGCVSDHSLSIVSFLQHSAKKNKPFKILNMWTVCESFLQVVETNWKFLGHGTEQYKLKQLLNGLKIPLLALNRKNFSHISTRAAAAKLELETLQRSLLNSGVMPNNYKVVKKLAELLLEAERLFIAQKTKCKFLKEGADVQSFFMIFSREITREALFWLSKNLMGLLARILQIYLPYFWSTSKTF